jgi:hypothetical protein
MLNVVDVLGEILDRVSSFAVDHWIFLAVVVLAIIFRKSRVAPTLLSVQLTDKSACATVFAISLATSIAYAWIHGMPLPQYHDDFAYLLDADTFAHGRMSNPTHPMWPHFETMHVLQMPRYISKYPIGQGLTFAAGAALLGHPLRFVWLLGAATCVAVWWALRAWMPSSLALAGAIATAIHPTMLEWMESYHGGELAALGGALLIGAAARDRRFGAIAAIGALLLAISRPYEGLIFCVAVAALFIRRLTIAGVAIALAGIALLGFHNRSITGSALKLPYSVYEQQYDPAPNFLWEKARPFPHYRNAEMEFVYRVTYLGQYKRVHAPGGVLDETLKKIDVIDRAIFGPANLENPRPLFLLLLIAAVPLLREDGKSRLLALALLIFAFAPFSIIWWLQLHYLAPATAVAAALAMLAMRRLFSASPILAVAVVVLFLVNAFMTKLPSSVMEPKRIDIAHSLIAQGGRHLIVVAPDVFDAVYNGADLDRAPIVWARDLGPAADVQLLRYYGDRKVWRLERGGLKPY